MIYREKSLAPLQAVCSTVLLSYLQRSIHRYLFFVLQNSVKVITRYALLQTYGVCSCICVAVLCALALAVIIQKSVFSPTIQTSRNAADAYFSVTLTTYQFVVLTISTLAAAVRYVTVSNSHLYGWTQFNTRMSVCC